MNIANYITLVCTVILSILILLQTRGASLGAGMGSGGEVNNVRRGADKTLHQITILFVIAFCLSLLYNLFR